MKYFTTLLIILTATPAHANLACGIPPIPPIGCSRDQAICLCNDYGNCEWVFMCR
jgi:hypothetical protein